MILYISGEMYDEQRKDYFFSFLCILDVVLHKKVTFLCSTSDLLQIFPYFCVKDMGYGWGKIYNKIYRTPISPE